MRDRTLPARHLVRLLLAGASRVVFFAAAPERAGVPASAVAHAQSVPHANLAPTGGRYTYTVGTGSIVPGSTDVGNHGDDTAVAVSLPFSYTLYNQSFTQVTVGSNGVLSFGVIDNGFNTKCLPVTVATAEIAPYWADQCTASCSGVTNTNLGVFTSISGSAPNRIFNIEWRTAYFGSGGAGVLLNYEVRLYEGQTAFDVVYGTINPFNGTGVSIGVQRTESAGQCTVGGCAFAPNGGAQPPVSTGQKYHYSLSTCSPTVGDFDGDCKSDFTVLRAAAPVQWYTQAASFFLAMPWGSATDLFLTGDYDGDGRADHAVYRNSQGTFYVRSSATGALIGQQWGVPGDTALIPGDYDGDGRTDFAVFRSGTWYVRRSQNGALVGQAFGQAGDSTAPGDYDGDFKTDFAVRRNQGGAGVFYLQQSTAGFAGIAWGLGGDYVVAGDYDGDGKTDVAVARVEGFGLTYYVRRSSDGQVFAKAWGLSGDYPVPGDYDGDGKTDLAVWRPSATPGASAFYVLKSSTLTLLAMPWGQNGDFPVLVFPLVPNGT